MPKLTPLIKECIDLAKKDHETGLITTQNVVLRILKQSKNALANNVLQRYGVTYQSFLEVLARDAIEYDSFEKQDVNTLHTEKYSKNCEEVLAWAENARYILGDNTIGMEHFIIGSLKCDCVAKKVFEKMVLDFHTMLVTFVFFIKGGHGVLSSHIHDLASSLLGKEKLIQKPLRGDELVASGIVECVNKYLNNEIDSKQLIKKTKKLCKIAGKVDKMYMNEFENKVSKQVS